MPLSRPGEFFSTKTSNASGSLTRIHPKRPGKAVFWSSLGLTLVVNRCTFFFRKCESCIVLPWYGNFRSSRRHNRDFGVADLAPGLFGFGEILWLKKEVFKRQKSTKHTIYWCYNDCNMIQNVSYIEQKNHSGYTAVPHMTSKFIGSLVKDLHRLAAIWVLWAG